LAGTFAYNGGGLRHSRTFAGNTAAFTWDAARSIPQVLDDETFRYVYGLGRIAQVSGTATHYYLTDGLGSTMALIDAAGAVVDAYDYDVFGALRGSTGTQPNEFTFAGEQVDAATGLQYLRARYYDMETGRFWSKDPLLGSVQKPSSQNRYAYALNNPCVYLDRSGLVSESVRYCHAIYRPYGFGDLVPFTQDPLFTLEASVVFIGRQPVALRASFEPGQITFGPDFGIVDINIYSDNDWESISLDKSMRPGSADIDLHARSANFETYFRVNITFSASGNIQISAKPYGEDFSAAYRTISLTNPFEYRFCSGAQ